MPLMSSSFTPGQAQATVNSFQDKGQRQIAQAELYYFSARAEECKDIAELYLAGQRYLSSPVRRTFIFFLKSHSGKSGCCQNGFQKYSGMSAPDRTEPIIK